MYPGPIAAHAMLLIIEQKEYMREDRFVRFSLLKEKLDHIYQEFPLLTVEQGTECPLAGSTIR